jgi:hypothetical protein
LKKEIYGRQFNKVMAIRRERNPKLRGFIVSLKSDEFELAKALEERVCFCQIFLEAKGVFNHML